MCKASKHCLDALYYIFSRQRSAGSAAPPTGVEEGKDTLRSTKYHTGGGEMVTSPQWDRQGKYSGTSGDNYTRDATSFSTMERDSGYTGSGYKTGASTDESAYYDQDSGPGGHFRQHIYESPQFS